MKYIAIVGGVLWLAACSSVVPVTPAGNDTYVVGSKKSVDQADWIEVRATATDSAVDFCNKQKKDMQGLDTQVPPALGSAPQMVNLTFKCVARKETK